MEKFLIIDGNSLINRAFYALPLLTNDLGEYSNAVYGFSNMLVKAIQEHKPTHIAVAFDYGKKTFRSKIFDMYKGTRKETPSELKSQFAILKKVLTAMNVKYYEKEGIEADDIIGTMAKLTDVETILLSGDKDLFQLVDKTTSVWFTKKGLSEIDTLTIDNIKQKFGLEPEQVIDFKSLKGDTSDNIPGVPGIGDKTAMTLLEKYHSVDGVYQHIEEIAGALKQKLIDGKESAYMSKQLATIKTDCDINFKLEDCTYDFPFSSEVYNIFKQYDFNSLTRRKDLFCDIEEQEVEVPFETIELKTKQKLAEVCKYAYESKVISFNLFPKIEFAFSPNFLYTTSNEITLFDEINNDDVLQQLKPILVDSNIKKITYDIKGNQHILGEEIQGEIFDISIAKYLIGSKDNSPITPNQYFSKKDELEKQMEVLGVEKIYNQIEMPIVNVLFEMENDGFAIDYDALEQLDKKLSFEKDNLEQKIYQGAGEKFNINSPKQLADVLFVKLGIVAYNNKKMSTSVDILEEIADKHEIIPMVLRYRKLQKLVAGYIEPYKELVKSKGQLLHTIYNQTLTATGRLSSSEPNLQNIPVRTEEGKDLRKMFISRFDDGEIVSADYSQIELKLLANFSGDKNLIEAYKNGEDIHSSTASKIFGVKIGEVTSNQRRSAKAVNFGVIYGISDYGLSQGIGCSRKEAKEYIDKYFEKYPDVKKYMDNNVEEASKTGYSTTMFGRIRRIPELESSNYMQKSFGMRVAMNMPLQGSASDIIKIAMINVQNEIKTRKLKSKLILTIHDELIIDSYPTEKDIVKEILKKQMENVVKLQVPLTVDISSGKTWYDCK